MNDKKYKKIEMGAWSIAAIALIVVLVVALNRDIFGVDRLFGNSSNPNMKIVREYTIKPTDKIQDINVNVDQGEIELLESNDDNIHIKLKSNKNMKDKDYLNIEENKSRLEIDSTKGNKIHFLNNANIQIEIQIPKSYNKNLSVETDVGDVVFNRNFDLNNLNIISDVGDIKLNKNIKCAELNIVSDIGDIYINGIDGRGSIKSDTGDINCIINRLKNNIEITSSIGDIELEVDRNLSFKFNSNKKLDHEDVNFNNVYRGDDSFYGEHGKNPIYTIKTNGDIGDIDIEYK